MIIYLITNTINGMRYIGQTVNPLIYRWSSHRTSAKGGYLTRAIKKYGAENFIIEVLCKAPTKELLSEMESYFINRYNTLSPHGYNLTTGGESPNHSIESRAKVSASLIGTKRALGCRHPHTEETKIKIRASLVGNKRSLGFKHSLETRAKMSAASKSRVTPERMAELRRLSWAKPCRDFKEITRKSSETKFLKTVAWG